MRPDSKGDPAFLPRKNCLLEFAPFRLGVRAGPFRLTTEIMHHRGGTPLDPHDGTGRTEDRAGGPVRSDPHYAVPSHPPGQMPGAQGSRGGPGGPVGPGGA